MDNHCDDVGDDHDDDDDNQLNGDVLLLVFQNHLFANRQICISASWYPADGAFIHCVPSFVFFNTKTHTEHHKK